MIKFEVENHKPSYLPDGEWKLVWADEFDGAELDRSKWDFRLKFWGKEFDGFTDKGAVLDGNLYRESITDIMDRYSPKRVERKERILKS